MAAITIHACIVASKIALATQTITLPDGAVHTEHVSIVSKCLDETVMHAAEAIGASDKSEPVKHWVVGPPQ